MSESTTAVRVGRAGPPHVEAVRGGPDWPLAAGFFSAVIAMYAGIAYGLYLLVF